VQCQNRLLLNVLDRNKTHIGPGNGFADRLRIRGIVLVGLDIRLDELGRHQLDGVPKSLQLARPVIQGSSAVGSKPRRRPMKSTIFALEIVML
jgi:hypothetical protein